jgi:hypothetical protein
VIEVRLITPLSSYSSKAGDPLEALVATPLCGAGGWTLPDGTVARGSVKHVHKVGIGLVHETARLELEFRELRLPDGRIIPLEARLTGVDNARERVDRRGAIRGVRATAALSNRFGARLALEVLEHPAPLIPLFVLTSGLLRFPEPEIVYGSGTEMYLEARLPPLDAISRCAMPQPASLAGLRRMVGAVPMWSYSKRQTQPLDPVTLFFVGSPSELARAFRAAGWTGSRDNSVSAGLLAIRAIAEDRAYSDAPMRTLLLDGAEPDFSFQKALNTFSKRHHLRIWNRPGTWEGRAVWASAATQDIGAIFSLRPFGVTHEIENDVDFERDKVVSDLVYTGCVDSLAYVPRETPLRASGRGYRRGINTDSRVAVVVLNGCEAPRWSAGELRASVLPRNPGAATRCLRRFVLSARNHFLRDNLYWRSAEAARLGVRAIRHWSEQRDDERRAQSRTAEAASATATAWPVAPELEPSPVVWWPLVTVGAMPE